MHNFLPTLLSLEIMVCGLYILSVYNFIQIRAWLKNKKAQPARPAASSAQAAAFSSSLQRRRDVA